MAIYFPQMSQLLNVYLTFSKIGEVKGTKREEVGLAHIKKKSSEQKQFLKTPLPEDYGTMCTLFFCKPSKQRQVHKD